MPRLPRWKDDLVPVQELRAGLAKFIEQVGESGRPLVVTQRGRAAAALISPALLDEIEAERELVRRVLRGVRDLKAGRLVDADDLLRKARKHLGGEAAGDPPGEEPVAGE